MASSELDSASPSRIAGHGEAGIIHQNTDRLENVITSKSAKGDAENDGDPVTVKSNHGFRFWVIILTLRITGLLAAFENSVVATSLPIIVRDLKMGDNYVWITNAFFLTSTAVQPLFGQLANVFGRRWVTIFIVAMFCLGSGICGGANSAAMLITGREVQGIGSGGINMMVDVIVSDLVPLRERGNFIAMVLTVYGLSTSVGPFLGGIIVQNTSWSWIFCLNLPIGGVALVFLFLFLHVNYKRDLTLMERLKRIDYNGNTIVVASTVSVLLALTNAGSRYLWSSWPTLVPLILGICGLFFFMAFENSNFCPHPVTPPQIFGNRTSAIVFVNTFLFTILLTGVQLLPAALVAIPGTAVAVIVLSKFGRYKILHLVGFAFLGIGLGLFTLLNSSSSTAEWVIFQVIAALGSEMVLNTLLPAFQTSLSESDQASTTATWAFIRSYGNIWGVAIPAAFFNNRFANLSHQISDPSVRALLSSGRAYEYASRDYVYALPDPLRSEVIDVFTQALKLVWGVSVVFAGLPFLLAFLEKQIPLRTELETEYGLTENGTRKQQSTDSEKDSSKKDTEENAD